MGDRKQPTPPPREPHKFEAMRDVFKRAFTEWERRYREDPDGFEHDFKTELAYGEAASDYFLRVLDDTAD